MFIALVNVVLLMQLSSACNGSRFTFFFRDDVHIF